MLVGLRYGIVGQVQSAQIHRKDVWVKQLDEVVFKQNLAVGEPFVYLQCLWIAEWLGDVWPAKGRNGKMPRLG